VAGCGLWVVALSPYRLWVVGWGLPVANRQFASRQKISFFAFLRTLHENSQLSVAQLKITKSNLSKNVY